MIDKKMFFLYWINHNKTYIFRSGNSGWASVDQTGVWNSRGNGEGSGENDEFHCRWLLDCCGSQNSEWYISQANTLCFIPVQFWTKEIWMVCWEPKCLVERIGDRHWNWQIDTQHCSVYWKSSMQSFNMSWDRMSSLLPPLFNSLGAFLSYILKVEVL